MKNWKRQNHKIHNAKRVFKQNLCAVYGAYITGYMCALERICTYRKRKTYGGTSHERKDYKADRENEETDHRS